MPPLLAPSLAAFLIAAIYYAWRDLYHQKRRRRVLANRVAYMLWSAANRSR